MAATPYREREPRTPARERETGCESPQRRPRDEPLEQPAEHAVVEERARRERRPRAVQDEEDPLSAQARGEGRDVREQVTRSVRDHDVGGADLTPEQSPAADRKRPARRPEEPRGNGHIGLRLARRRPAGEDANVPALSAEELRRDVHELLDASDAGEARSSRRSTRARGADFPGSALTLRARRAPDAAAVFPCSPEPGHQEQDVGGAEHDRELEEAPRIGGRTWCLPCWSIPMRCE